MAEALRDDARHLRGALSEAYGRGPRILRAEGPTRRDARPRVPRRDAGPGRLERVRRIPSVDGMLVGGPGPDTAEPTPPCRDGQRTAGRFPMSPRMKWWLLYSLYFIAVICVGTGMLLWFSGLV